MLNLGGRDMGVYIFLLWSLGLKCFRNKMNKSPQGVYFQMKRHKALVIFIIKLYRIGKLEEGCPHHPRDG